MLDKYNVFYCNQIKHITLFFSCEEENNEFTGTCFSLSALVHVLNYRVSYEIFIKRSDENIDISTDN